MSQKDKVDVLLRKIQYRNRGENYRIIHINPLGVDAKNQEALLKAMKGVYAYVPDAHQGFTTDKIELCTFEEGKARHEQNHIFFLVHQSLIPKNFDTLVNALLNADAEKLSEAREKLENAIAQKRQQVSVKEFFKGAEPQIREIAEHLEDKEKKSSEDSENIGVRCPTLEDRNRFEKIIKRGHIRHKDGTPYSLEEAKPLWDRYVKAYTRRFMTFQIAKENYQAIRGSSSGEKVIRATQGDSLFVSYLNHDLKKLLYVPVKDTDQVMEGDPDKFFKGLKEYFERKARQESNLGKISFMGMIFSLAKGKTGKGNPFIYVSDVKGSQKYRDFDRRREGKEWPFEEEQQLMENLVKQGYKFIVSFKEGQTLVGGEMPKGRRCVIQLQVPGDRYAFTIYEEKQKKNTDLEQEESEILFHANVLNTFIDYCCKDENGNFLKENGKPSVDKSRVSEFKQWYKQTQGNGIPFEKWRKEKSEKQVVSYQPKEKQKQNSQEKS